MGSAVGRRREDGGRRLLSLLAAGLVDSFALSLAWTVVVLEVTSRYGLVAAGACSTAMLIGIALSAPVATWMSQRFEGVRLLRTAGSIEAVLRLSVLGLLTSGAPVWILAVTVTAMNVVAWTGYAGMRAEVASVSEGAGALTWYGTVVAAVEAIGVAAGALLPVGTDGRPTHVVLLGVTLLYVAALVPTLVVAGGSTVPRAARVLRQSLRRQRPSRVTVQGALLMSVSSAPTLLAVALAAEMHGRGSVGPAAAAFTAGSLVAPAAASFIDRTRRNHLGWWLVLAAGMVAGWTMASRSIVLLCVAQVLSGLCMTTLEGLLDTRASRERPDAVTAALARATAARALGSSAGTAVLPVVVAGAGLAATTTFITGGLLTAAVVVQLVLHYPWPAPALSELTAREESAAG